MYSEWLLLNVNVFGDFLRVAAVATVLRRGAAVTQLTLGAARFSPENTRKPLILNRRLGQSIFILRCPPQAGVKLLSVYF